MIGDGLSSSSLCVLMHSVVSAGELLNCFIHDHSPETRCVLVIDLFQPVSNNLLVCFMFFLEQDV